MNALTRDHKSGKVTLPEFEKLVKADLRATHGKREYTHREKIEAYQRVFCRLEKQFALTP